MFQSRDVEEVKAEVIYPLAMWIRWFEVANELSISMVKIAGYPPSLLPPSAIATTVALGLNVWSGQVPFDKSLIELRQLAIGIVNRRGIA